MTYLIGGKTLSATTESGITYSLTSDHPHFSIIREALLAGENDEKVIALFDAAAAASKFTQGQVEARFGTLYFKGEPVHNYVAKQILDFMGRGLPYQPLVNCLERAQKNPSKHSLDELFKFVEANDLPITEDGFVLGYKGISEDWKDDYSGTVDNSIGAKPRMERNLVDDNWNKLCSSGYHVGSLKYANGLGRRTVIVKFDPADAVSVPEGQHSWKLRVCAYEVLREISRENPKALPKRTTLTSDPYAGESAVLSFFRNLFGIKRKSN